MNSFNKGRLNMVDQVINMIDRDFDDIQVLKEELTNIQMMLERNDNYDDEIKKYNHEKAEDIVIEDIDFTVKTYNFLKRHGVNILGDLSGMDMDSLMKVRNLSRSNHQEVITKLKEYGLKLLDID